MAKPVAQAGQECVTAGGRLEAALVTANGRIAAWQRFYGRVKRAVRNPKVPKPSA